jgi:hypothetical protein
MNERVLNLMAVKWNVGMRTNKLLNPLKRTENFLVPVRELR